MAGPFKLCWTPEAQAQYDALKSRAVASLEAREKAKRAKATKDEGLFKQVHKAITHLESDPRHPGLRTHEYATLANPFDPRGKVFEAYAQNKTPGAYRIFWCYGPQEGELTIIAITPHP